MSEIAGFRILQVVARRIFEKLKQLCTRAHCGNAQRFNSPFEIARDRFINANAQDRVRIRSALTYYQRDVGKLATAFESESLDFFCDGSDFNFAIAAFEEA